MNGKHPKDRDLKLSERYRIFSARPELGINGLNIGRRTFNALRGAHYTKLLEIADLTDADLLRIRGFGRKCLAELLESLDHDGRMPCLPSKLPNNPIRDLGLSNRVSRALGKVGFKRIKSLQSVPIASLKKIRGLVPADIDAIVNTCVHVAQELDRVGDVYEMPKESTDAYKDSLLGHSESFRGSQSSFLVSLDHALDSVSSDWGKEAVRLRLGLNGAVLTLQEIGEKFGFTRERIRQVTTRYIEQLKLPGEPLHEMWVALTEVLADRRIPLAVNSIPHEHSYFAGMDQVAPALSKLLSMWVDDVYVVEHFSEEFVVIGKVSEWHEACQIVHSIRDQAVENQWSVNRFMADVRDVGITFNMQYMGAILEDIAESKLTYTADKKWIVSGPVKTLEQKAKSILNRAKKPVHYKVIAQKINSEFGTNYTAHHVNSSMRGAGGILLGRGMYGLEAHLPIKKSDFSEIQERVKEILLTNPERQWHCNEILYHLKISGPRDFKSLDVYVLAHVLRVSKDFVDLGRQIFALTDSPESVLNSRHDVMALVERVLRCSEGPMPTNEVKEELSRYRGLSTNFQIRPTDNILAVDRGVWGLVGRDIVPKTELIDILDTIELRAKASGGELSENELQNLVDAEGGAFGEGFNASVLLSLANLDERFRVTADRSVILVA